MCLDCKEKLPFLSFYLPSILFPSIQLPEGVAASGDCKLAFWTKWIEDNKSDWSPTNLFLTKQWFLQLCECEKCKTLYESTNFTSIMADMKENETAYDKDNEEKGKQESTETTSTQAENSNGSAHPQLGKRKTDLYQLAQERFLQTPQIPTAAKVDMIQAQKMFQTQLVDFLKEKGFMGTGKIVTKEDIEQFTETLKKRKS
jgi:hypothetical protein